MGSRLQYVLAVDLFADDACFLETCFLETCFFWGMEIYKKNVQGLFIAFSGRGVIFTRVVLRIEPEWMP